MQHSSTGRPRVLKNSLLVLMGLALLVACGEPPGQHEPPSSVAILDSVSELTVGESYRFTAVAQTPTGLSTDIAWSSSEPGFATVTEAGLVTGVAAGSTTITARSLLEPAAIAELALTVTAKADPEEPVDPIEPEEPMEPAVGLHYLDPTDFSGNTLHFKLPPSETDRTLLIVSPNLDTTDYVLRNDYVHDQLYEFTVTTSPERTGSSAPLKPMPQPPELTLSDWSAPSTEVSAPPASYQFSIWSPDDGSYVSVPGSLAYASDHLAFYEDPANTSNFTQAEYQTIGSLVDSNFPELTRLMGAPTDLDGNGKIKVFISSTMMDIRSFGEAYVDGCHMLRPTPRGCSGPGEFIYFAALDHYDIGSNDDRHFFVTDYYPGNILHEAVHLLQMAHSYRRFGNYWGFSSAAYRSEGQAELIKFLTGISAERNWERVADQLSDRRQEHRNLWFQPYDLGGPLMLFLQDYGGEGFSQAFIDRMYDSDHHQNSLLEPILGVPEPLLYASFYGALLFDGTPTGQRTGLQFNDFDVTRETHGVRPPVPLLSDADSAAVERTFTGAAILEIDHESSVWVELESRPEAAYVLVVTPAE